MEKGNGDLFSDTVSFDELEGNFNRVIQDIMNDRSLEKFKNEYEKLHQALGNSHEYNQVLVEKCRGLNDEILKNTSKISQVISLSHQDQKIIAGLRNEFEKAWKIVENAKEREDKSIKIIDNLKVEIENLVNLVHEGGVISEHHDTTIQNERDMVTNLKIEKEANIAQISYLRSQISETKELLKRNNDKIQQLNQNEKSLVLEISENEILESNAKKDQCVIMDQIETTKESIISLKQESDTIINNITQKEVDISKYHPQLWELNLQMSTEHDEKGDHDVNIRKQQIYLHKKKSVSNQTEKSLKDRLDIDQKKRENEPNYDQILQEVENENIALLNEYEELKNIRVDVEKRKSDMSLSLKQNRENLFHLASMLNNVELEIRTCAHVIQNYEKYNREMQNEIKVIDNEHNKQVSSINSIEEQIVTEKSYKYKTKEHINRIALLIVDKEEIIGSIKTNSVGANEQQKLNDEDLNVLNTKLKETSSQIAQIAMINDSTRAEKDVLYTKLQATNRANQEIIHDTGTLKSQVVHIKEEIRLHDIECAKKHLSFIDIENKVAQLHNDKQMVKLKISEIAEQNGKILTEISKYHHLLNESEIDLSRIKRDCYSLNESTMAIANSITKKLNERNIIVSKIGVLTNMISKYWKSFNDQTSIIKKFKSNLRNEVEKNKLLLNGVKRLKLLKDEYNMYEKRLLIEREKSIVLEEEMQHPVVIHHRSLLESLDPEAAHLLNMKHQIIAKINALTSYMDRLKEKRKQQFIQKDVQTKHLMMNEYTNYSQQFTFLTQALDVKTRQISQLEQLAINQQEKISERREEVSTVRTQIRKQKLVLSSYQQLNFTNRSSTAVVNTRKISLILPIDNNSGKQIEAPLSSRQNSQWNSIFDSISSPTPTPNSSRNRSIETVHTPRIPKYPSNAPPRVRKITPNVCK